MPYQGSVIKEKNKINDHMNPEKNSIRWSCKKFHELSPEEIYQILRLRSEVFVVEQNCVFLDQDNKDQHCWHYMGHANGLLVAYVRLLPAGLAFKEVSIGRVVTSPSARRKGFGRSLMENAITEAWRLFGRQDIRIGAQCYLEDFYASLGFKPEGDTYLEDDILHIEMLLTA
jgi:ElaA protein